jgi:hypothetical protein
MYGGKKTMRLVKRVAILAGLAAGAALVTASAALAHDDDRGRGWKHGHWRHHHHHRHYDRFVYERSRPIIVERPVIYRSYREPMYPYYPPGPPSLNINIPLR